MEHHSLDDYTAEYRQYLSQVNPGTSNVQLYRAWSHHVDSKISDTDRPLYEKTCYKYLARFAWGEYSALSYTWGSPTPARNIVIDSRLVEVGPNLEAALRTLHGYTQRLHGLKLWVDAICINQADEEEKAIQVKRMKDIYSNSAVTRIWLGESDEDTAPFFSFLGYCHDTIVSAVERDDDSITDSFFGDPASGASVARPFPDDVHGSDDSFELTPAQNRELVNLAVAHILKKPYWTRAWIIQELAVSAPWAAIHCGPHILPWMHLANVVRYLYRHPEVLPELLLNVQNPEIAAAHHLVHSMQRWQHDAHEAQQGENGQGLPPIIYDWVYLGLTANATLPLDKVYALLGLMPSTIADYIVPDYSADPLDVYARFTGAVLCETGNLNLICNPDPYRPEGFPSWAINLNAPFNRPAGATAVNEVLHSASASLKASARLSSDGKVLYCQGFRVDRIDGIGAYVNQRILAQDGMKYLVEEGGMVTMQGEVPQRFSGYCGQNDPPAHVAANVAPEAQVIIQPRRKDHAYTDEKELRYALASVLLHNDGRDTKHIMANLRALTTQLEGRGLGDMPRREEEILWVPWFETEHLEDPMFVKMKEKGWDPVLDSDYFGAFHTFREANAQFNIFGRSFQSFFPGKVDDVPEYESGINAAISQAACIQLQGRKLITTSNGLLGSVSTMGESGNDLYILRGCSVPLVLRPKNDNFEVVGAAYVHGLMDGEAVDLVEKGVYRWGEIRLC